MCRTLASLTRTVSVGFFWTVVGASVVACGSNVEENNTTRSGSGGSGGSGTTGGTGGTTSGTGGATAGSGGATGGTGGATGGTGGATGGTGGTGGATGGTGGATGGTGGAAGSAGKGGAAGTGGTTDGGATGGSAGKAGSAGASGSGGAAGAAGAGGTGGTGDAGACTPGAGSTAKFSFFATSLNAVKRVSGNPLGFGGDLRFGKGDGLTGADEICRVIADYAYPGAGCKQWRAFLSVTKGPAGTPVNAIDRVGEGPWYDRLGRTFATNKAGLATTRPTGADPAIVNDLPNEDGVPNHAPDSDGKQVDNHDFITGSTAAGLVDSGGLKSTCQDWTSAVGSGGTPVCGHTWPRGTQSWISVLKESGCAPGVNIVEMGGPISGDPSIGSGGGYGGFYCFALTP